VGAAAGPFGLCSRRSPSHRASASRRVQTLTVACRRCKKLVGLIREELQGSPGQRARDPHSETLFPPGEMSCLRRRGAHDRAERMRWDALRVTLATPGHQPACSSEDNKEGVRQARGASRRPWSGFSPGGSWSTDGGGVPSCRRTRSRAARSVCRAERTSSRDVCRSSPFSCVEAI
jgi:hypothetical protein